MEKIDLKTLGKPGSEGFVGLETFKVDFPALVALTSNEFTAMCPVTGQPDQYTISVVYTSQKVCLESKSLKLYLQGYRNEGEFVEKLTKKILEDVVKILKPLWAFVQIAQKPRGGIEIIARSSFGDIAVPKEFEICHHNH